MKLVTFSPKTSVPRLGAVIGPWDRWESVLDLELAARRAGGKLPADMLSFIDVCGELKGPKWTLALKLVAAAQSGKMRGSKALLSASKVRIHAPFKPRMLRDSIAMRGHVARTRAARGTTVPPEWDKLIGYFNGNPLNVIGPEEEVSIRRFVTHENGELRKTPTAKLDYEAELGYVVGCGGSDIPSSEASRCLFGVTLFNDFSMRDLQLEVMKIGMGPAAGKDWANALGPCILTRDELGDLAARRIRLVVSGETRMEGTYRQLVYESPWVKPGERAVWTFEEMAEFFSHCQRIHPGELWGSGTLPGGCELERGPEARYLKSGDTVEFELEGVGTLRNRVGGDSGDGG